MFLFWACGIPFSNHFSQHITKIDDSFYLRENGLDDTVLVFKKYVWISDTITEPNDTFWRAVLLKPEYIISYPNQYLLAKDSKGYFVMGYKDGLAEYWDYHRDKEKFIKYATKIGAPLAGIENW